MGDRSKLVKSLSADELRRLTERLKKGQGEAERIGRAPRDGAPLALSFSQERLWFLDRFAPGNPAYNIPSFVRLAGRLDATALRRTLAEVTRRHESLRTTFGECDGVAFQVIAPAAAPHLPLVDLSALPAGAREGETLRLALEEARRPFDLAQGPLFRASLARLADEEHVLLLNLHHIVSDGWSQGVLIRELAALYEAMVQSRPSVLPELPIQYADYAAWQRNRLQGEVLEKELAFWRGRLAGTPPLELPSDRPRALQPSFHGGHQSVGVAEEVPSRLQALCRREEVTSYMTLLAAFQTLLLRYSGQTDFAVGSPVANRAHSELEGLIGFFVNTLALRADLADRPTFRELLRRVKEAAVEAWSHEETPFERIVEDLHPEREAGRNPVFQVILALQSQSRQDLAMGGLDVSVIEAATGTAKVDLLLSWREEPGRLLGTLEYSSDLFDAASAGRMARHAVALLQGALEDPDRTVWELPLMDEAERGQTLVDWNRTASAYPREAAVHQLFEEQVERNGGAVALEFEDQRLTYAELNARANQVAHRLRRVDVGPESLVVLSVSRSVEMIVGMLGILKAGGAYLPLDPSQPPERLALLVEESRPAALVTLEAHLASLPDFGGRALALDRDRGDLEREQADNPRGGAGADHLAYVLYTSGSTGRPKAVAVPHRGLVRLIRGANYARLDAGETFFQFAPLSFDPSTLEIFGALANGGRLAVAPPGAYSLAELGRVIRRHGVTTLWLTSGLFHQMIEEGLDDLRGVRQLMSGGDVLSPPHIRRALAALPGVEIVDGYGPTENSCFTTCYRVDPQAPPVTSVPIGRPVANTTVYILDGELRPVPVGVPGELCTGGDGLARGYLARPELTAERFIPSPLAGAQDAPGARLYRTGDLARWRPDGDLDFLGRMDSQVKIRGYRIEPGEVEAVLAEHPALAECAVVVRREDSGERRLVAWYIPSSPVAPTELKEHLGARLPAYMVPSAFVQIAAMPLTVSGKVDRRALARLEAPAGDGPSEAYAEPATLVEKRIAAIWADLLHRERIGRHDDFFDLGGHSLLATRVLSRLRESLQVDLPLTTLFESSTLSALAATVEAARGAGLGARDAAASPAGSDQPLSFSQERLWFLEQLQPGTSAYNIPSGVRLRGRLDPGAFAGALREIARRHQVLRITLGESQGEPVQRVSPAADVPLARVDLSALPAARREEERERLTTREARRPFDLVRGPLLRALLLRLGPEDHVALITIHHIATDGWSMAVFIRELVTLYQAAVEGRTSPLPEPPLQYFDFTRWQRDWLRGDRLEELLVYWRQALAGAPEVLELPSDHSRPPVRSFRGSSVSFELDEPLTRKLRNLARESRGTLFMVLLAGLDTLLSRYSRQTDLAVGSVIANRNRAEWESLIGFFVNSLVMRVRWDGNPSFGELLGQVRNVTLGAFEHQDLPFEKVVEDLQPERSLAHSPLFQVMFALQNNEAPSIEVPGLRLEPHSIGAITAKFDLTFLLGDRDGRINGTLEYATDLFDEPTVTRLVEHFRNLLAAAAATPRAALSELPLLSAAESRQILLDLSAGEPLPPIGAEDFLHRAFERQVERTPDAEALVWRDVRWTYRELNSRANRLAHRLRSLGVGPESLVAVLMTRTADLVTALMAVLKSGGAYVPLDPHYPEERVAFALEDTQARVAVVDEALAGRVPGLHTVILPGALDERLSTGEKNHEENPGVEVDGENLAYIIYTSGSTGRPKGVAIRHRSAAALVPWSRPVFSDEDMAAVLGSTSICFDMSVFEIFVTLARGGRIILSTDALELPLLPARDEVVLVDTVPSAIAELVRSGGVPAGVRVVNLGGEPLKRALTDAVYRLGHVRDVVNLYGPSEDTTFSTWARIEESAEAAPSIGRPLSGSSLYLLDPEMRPAPLGVPGEVYIGGAGLSRGYLNRPELTAEKFVPDPFATGGAAGGRLYRTGDLARYRPDRQLEFLGRLDHQVKIRGYRVELGEVESALLRHPAVRDAVVMARGEEAERRLVAYVVADREPEPPLRAWIREILPEPMVPATFVELAALPLTPNGKVDRKALPDPEALEAAPESEEAPRTPLESAVAAIWREVLGVGRIGVHDDFFELGGHSLLATRVASRVSSDFGVTLSVRQIFEASTVEAMAAEIGKAGGRTAVAATKTESIPRRAAGDRDLPLSFSQERLWFLDRLEPGTPSFNIAATVRLTGELRVGVLAAAQDEIFRRHESLRTVFVAVDGVARQRVLPRMKSSVPVVDLTGLPEEVRRLEAARISQEHSYWRFDLTRGPLLVMTLLRLEPEVHHALLNFHHIVSDGWSLGVFLRELGALYEAFGQGRPAPLPELPIQYPDFALWQRRAISDILEGQVSYWMRQLEGEIPPLELSTDRPRPAVQSYRGLSRHLTLPAELASRLHTLSRRRGATLFMTLLAAAKALLHRLSGQDDILVGAPIAGRQRVETEELIGFFLNTLVFRTDLSGAPSFAALLDRVRAVTLGAYSHQDVPFEALLARLPQQRDMSRTPLFQIMFNMLNLPDGEARLTGLTIEPQEIPELPSKFDMTFYVGEAGEEIYFHLLYNADLFDAARMDEVLAQYTLLLEQAVERTETSIEALSLVTARSRAVLPDPAAPLDASWSGAIHDLFSRHARTAPERTAIADREGVWTYGELETAANRLAGWLLARGIRKGDAVAVYAHRSAPVALAVLGILKAGAAFTLLDPAYPPARLAEILLLSGARALVRLEAAGPLPDAVETWLAESGHPAVDLPRGGAAAALTRLDGFAGEPPAVTVGPDDVAVLGFTSGSTGRPKGIAGRHGPLTHFLPWQCERFGLHREDRFSLLSGLAHDPLQRDLFTPFYLGATVVVPDPQDLGVAGRLAEWMAREAVTVAHLTPAMAQVVTERPAGGASREVPGLRLVLLVGDALTRLDVARIRRLAPRVTCVNLYGSTETQRAVAFHVVDADCDERGPQVLPLGRGMQDVQLLVVNREGLLAGVGEVGEIAMRSPHLAQGYLDDPALTTEKFHANPFTGDPADRVYRTGDLGRYLPDGEATFAGRADLQVKIRGFRIEPGEIEATLGALPGVREAVAVVREERGEKRLVAYVVPDGAGVSVPFLRQSLRERLPVYMVPAAFVLLERLPITPNGKVDRRALPAPAEDAGAAPGLLAPEGDLEEKIAAVWREVLGIEKVGVQDNFFDVGGHSLLLVRLHSRLQEALGREISLMDLFSHPNIRSQAAHLGGGKAENSPAAPERRATGGRIAIVGLAGRFPRAQDLDQFWRNLRDGVDAVSHFPDEELAARGVGEETLGNPKFVKARAVLEDEAMFDADFFGFSPLQAALMDPQLRVVLECSWEAMENAGYDPRRVAGEVGVYAGVSLSTYFLHNLATNPALIQEAGGYQMAIGTDRDYLASQISYKLGLTGPSVDVQTACSTSLVAVHMACQALLTGDCDMALAGGVSIKVPQIAGYLHQEGGIDSAQGRCRAFDAAADGTVWGSGVGLVALKRLEDAEADGDTIHAVILGSALNNDGALKVGFTAPSVEAQAKVIAAAQRRAGAAAETIGYVEAHGTGTHLGDPIEVAALTRAFRAGTERTGFCPIGSVKTNIGHLGAAAGVASLLKTVLALRHRQLPPSLHFETPNPAIDFASSPFYVNTGLAEWPAGGSPRRAGVSSFGLGGTNAHVVVEEAPEPAASGPARPWQLFVLSARDEAALERATENLASWLEEDRPAHELADAAFTLQTGRQAFPVRRALVCRDAAEARQALRELPPDRAWTAACDDSRRPVVFLFPGQGAQHVEMGRGLYATEPVFRRELDACAERLRASLGHDLRRVLFPTGGEREEAEVLLRQTRFTQPALFAVEYALARLWLSWGVRPAAMIGHSLGEYVAACLAGVFSLDDALELVARRAELMQELPPGAMLSVELPEEEVAALLSPASGLSLAAVNGPSFCVVSGPEEAVAALEGQLAERGAATRRLHTSYAFHSAATEPVLEPFRRIVQRVETRPASLPYLSNLTGGWIEPGATVDPDYWVRHLRHTVRFGDGIAHLLDRFEGQRPVLLEVGPGSTLTTLARRQAREAGGAMALSSMRHPRSLDADEAVLLGALGRLWLAGADIDWDGFHAGERRRRIPLPTYPFQRRRFWVEPGQGAALPLQPARVELGEDAVSQDARTPAAPRNEIERWVASTMSALLGVPQVGIRDDFFELGGHSLLGTRLLSRLRDELGVELPIAALFESPTVAALAEAIAAHRNETPLATHPVVPVPRGGDLPLSFAQERFWFLDRLEPGGFGYNMSSGVRLTGELSVPALLASLTEILRRHEALRTVFPAKNGEPMQLIQTARPVTLSIVDLSALPAGKRVEELDRRLSVEARRPFDLAAGPLLRHMLLRLAEDEHALTFSAHHIVADMWSTGLLVREISELYPAALLGEASPLPELRVQYADFAAWQRRWLTGETLEHLLAGWRARLEGAPAALEIPTDRPRPAVQTFRGASARRTVGPARTAPLHRLAQNEGATFFMALLAVYQGLLHRYSGQPEVVVGSPIAGRTREEVAPLIGVFINTLALRADLSGNPSFRELLARTREVALEAYALQDLPFEKLVEEIKPARDLSRTPLFQAMLVLQNVPSQALALPRLTMETLPMSSGAAKFELTLWLAEGESGLAAALEHNTDLFELSTAERMIRHFETLLTAATADPSRGIDELPLLGEDERRQILTDWNDTRVDGLSSGFIHELVQAQAARTPQAAAVAAGSVEITYQALTERIHQLARHLQRLGVGLETRVGVCLERTADLPVALLAILEAGGCYVPLDPSYPRERLAYMMEDSAAPVVITQESLRDALPPHQAWVVSIDGDAPAIELESAEVPEVDLDSAHLAYVLYTSGSTGKPKGVQIPHGALVNFLLSMRERPGLGAADVLLAVTPVSFDIAGLELYVPLLAGGRVVLANREDAQDGARLQGLITRSGATAMQATPATWRLLVESGWRGDGRLKALCGGEALPDALAAQLLERSGEVWNLYGPTETTIWSTVQQVRPGHRITLGRPIANTQIYVLEPTGEPAPAGVPGELLIGGDGLARGYFGRPDLTAERFVPDPFRGGGARLYRTGDLARFRPGGELEFLGRLDFQVKVRGYRIELGEIETVLGRHLSVAQAVVVARVQGEGDARLVAYAVLNPGAAPADPQELREHARASLPEYMVPSAVVVLEAFPLTPNGKVDRKALPAPDVFEGEREYVAPATPTEEALAAVWAGVLGLERVGTRDNFFAMGGHSVLATRLMFRIRETLGVDLPLRTLFEAPTVARLATAVAARRAEAVETSAELPAIEPNAAEGHLPFPLTDVQEAYWIGRSGALELGAVSTHLYFEIDMPELDVARLNHALRRLIDRHGMLRAIVLADGRQQILPAVPPYEVTVLDLRAVGPQEGDRGALEARERMSHQVLPSDRWPLFEIAATLLPDRARLHVSLDLLIGDAWSFRILGREVSVLYVNPDLELPRLDLSFRDYVVAEAALRESRAYQKALAYWRERLAALPPAPALPLAKQPGEIETPRFARRTGRLGREGWERLKARATQEALTPSGVLLAAWSEVLAAWSETPDLTINLTLFNRLPLHPQVDDIVGDFTSLTLLAVERSPGLAFGERARRLQGRLWDDLDHRLVSGVRVLRELARLRGGRGTAMPVVFTSTLNQAEEAPVETGEAPAEAGRPVYSISQTPQVWLDHQVFESRGALAYVWDAVEELFPAGMLDDMFAAYEGLLGRLAEGEAVWSEPVRDLLPADQLRILAGYNDTAAPIPAGLLHEPFLEQAALRPEADAVITSSRRLTYGQLDRASLALAHRLRRLGVRPNQLVGIVMEKGWEQVVAAFAILRAGGAYLPIDAHLPAERLHYLLERGEVAVALTQAPFASSLDWPASVARIAVDDSDFAGPAMEPLPAVQGPEDLAYVIFTSGSTGLPKGVMIDHRGALNTCVDVNLIFGAGPEDRVFALSQLSFDLSVYDIFGLLAAGGALVIPDAGTNRDPRHWAELSTHAGVTIWNSVPALMEMLVEYGAGRPGALGFPLRAVTMSGDWIPPRLPDRIRAAFPGVQIVSMGGATEASIWSIHYPIGEVGGEWVSIPYGRPMRNQTFFVLDRELEPRPLGVQGDLYIGGIGLARGYWRDEEKTRAQFLTHPRTGEPLYRTGDLGRRLPDGDIEFLGRSDFQVKVQGHRIELGEIESTLTQHPAVAAAVVDARGDLRGAKQLVGYVVLKKPGEEVPEALVRADGGAWAGLPAAAAPPVHLARRRFHRAPVPLDDLGAVLGSLLRLEIDGSPFPKLRYGSAGNLYPVQAYVYAAPGKVEGLPGGAYYYDPSGHALALLAEGTAVDPSLFAPADREVFEEAGFAIFLIARMAAITPLYGAPGRRFAALEAGLMAELLAGAAAEHGLGLSPAAGRLGELRGALRLEESHEPLLALLGGFADPDREAPAAQPFEVAEEAPAVPGKVLTDPIERLRFKTAHHGLRPDDGGPRIELPRPRLTPERIEALYVARRSYRRFPDEEPAPLADLGALLAALPAETPGLGLFLYAKPGRVAGLPGGTYRYEPAGHRLTLLEEGAALTGSLFDPVNQGVFEQAGFALLFVGRGGRAMAVEAGRRAQILETAAPSHRLGLAQIGGLRLDPVRTFFRLEPGDELVHLLLGGRIAAGQARLAAYLAEVAEYHALADGLGTAPAAAPKKADLLAELRGFLRGKLPEYMVPAHLMRLDALPLSSNGKVDRKALPEPETLRQADGPAGGAYVAPETDLERVIAGVVAQVLGVPQVGAHDNFFDLGANSVHVVRVHNALHAALGREISLIDMFNHPSVHRLAQHLGESEAGTAMPAPSQAEERAGRLREGKDWRKQRLQKRQTDRGQQ